MSPAIHSGLYLARMFHYLLLFQGANTLRHLALNERVNASSDPSHDKLHKELWGAMFLWWRMLPDGREWRASRYRSTRILVGTWTFHRVVYSIITVVCNWPNLPLSHAVAFSLFGWAPYRLSEPKTPLAIIVPSLEFRLSSTRLILDNLNSWKAK